MFADLVRVRPRHGQRTSCGGAASALPGLSLAVFGALVCVGALAAGFIAMIHKSS